jgi:hypothetical protein
MAREAYELTIEFGAHPNVRSVAEHVRLDDEEPRLSLVYLHAAPSTAAARAIVACIETALVILFMSDASPNNRIFGQQALVRTEESHDGPGDFIRRCQSV